MAIWSSGDPVHLTNTAYGDVAAALVAKLNNAGGDKAAHDAAAAAAAAAVGAPAEAQALEMGRILWTKRGGALAGC